MGFYGKDIILDEQNGSKVAHGVFFFPWSIYLYPFGFGIRQFEVHPNHIGYSYSTP